MKRRRLRVVVTFRAARSRLSRFVTGSMAVHGALLAAVLIVPATRQRVVPIEDTMVVALAGPIAAAPAARAASAPSAAAPAPAPKEAHTVREVPVPKPKDKPVKPKKEPEKAPEKAPEKPPGPVTPPSHPGAAPGTPQASNPAPGQGAVTATLGTGDSSLGWYGAAVKAALESAWAKPYLEDAQGTASVVVTFDIARDGTTRNIRILEPSGIPSLDRSAQRAVIEASPLPAIPPSWTEGSIPVTMRFDLTPEAR